MVSTIFAIVIMVAVIGFSLVMASDVHDYMTNHNAIEEFTVFDQAFE